VYRNPDAYPRVWVTHEAVSVPKADDAAGTLERPGFDPHKTVFVTGPAPQLEKCGEQEITRLVDRRSDRLTIEADLHCRGMVIVGETYAPGWVASVDGRPAPVYEAYTFLRGIVVEPGGHRIEMRYRPPSVLWGAALTVLGLLGAVALRFVA
jgi:hypothetical protein